MEVWLNTKDAAIGIIRLDIYELWKSNLFLLRDLVFTPPKNNLKFITFIDSDVYKLNFAIPCILTTYQLIEIIIPSTAITIAIIIAIIVRQMNDKYWVTAQWQFMND